MIKRSNSRKYLLLGEGVEVDYKKAVSWFEKSAAKTMAERK